MPWGGAGLPLDHGFRKRNDGHGELYSATSSFCTLPRTCDDVFDRYLGTAPLIVLLCEYLEAS